MKNQYVGDINDYRKYGLLRCLLGETRLKLCVAWMLTEDDGGNDGARRAYLKDRGRWAGYDSELFDSLSRVVDAGSPLDVALIEGRGILNGATFFALPVKDGSDERRHWRRELLAHAEKCDLVFLDPDNGIEVPSKPIGRQGSSKYVAWEDLHALWNAGHSILVYQHNRRLKREMFVQELVEDLRDTLGAQSVNVIESPHVLFLLMTQPKHEAQIRRAAHRITQAWAGQLQICNGGGAGS